MMIHSFSEWKAEYVYKKITCGHEFMFAIRLRVFIFAFGNKGYLSAEKLLQGVRMLLRNMVRRAMFCRRLNLSSVAVLLTLTVN